MNKSNKWIAAILVPLSLLVGVKQFESSGNEYPVPYKDIVGVLTVCIRPLATLARDNSKTMLFSPAYNTAF